MKRLISLALALVMVLVVFTACGTPVSPVGRYADETGTSIIEVGAYDAKAKSGTLKITNTINTDLVIEGTYTLEENEAKVSSWVDFTAADGTLTTFIYDSTMDALQDQTSGITYFGPNHTDGGAPAAE